MRVLLDSNAYSNEPFAKFVAQRYSIRGRYLRNFAKGSHG